MLKRDKPSEYFLGAILRGYDTDLKDGRVPTVSGIWNQICKECILRTGAFESMFQWDTSKAKNGTNRVRDIAECFERGLVPGLELTQNSRGKEVVTPL